MNSLKKFLKGFKKGMHNFGQTIVIVINTVLLTIVYFIGIGLTSIIAKLVGKHFLDISNKDRKTHWSDLNLRKKSIEEYYRQF